MNLSELRQISVKVVRPAQISGGGERWREKSGNFPLSQNSNFASRNPRVGTPTKPLSRDDSRCSPFQLLSKVMTPMRAGTAAFTEMVSLFLPLLRKNEFIFKYAS
ncbi:hypothetical protein [Leptospira ainlahdjerensis]|uniref:hypothetical protein n=1 Tax=Leptospira ainlahdjerensis TaxID=2810033 RepID=UPI0019658318|nr:hypothetical protein [Leptospira ainlahdjerensis]